MKVELIDIPKVAEIVQNAEAELCKVTGVPVHIVLVRENTDINPGELLQIVAKSLAIDVRQLRTNDRRRKLVDARKIFSFIGRTLYNFGVLEMGNVLNVHHSSVIYYVKVSAHHLRHYPDFKEKYDIILKNIQYG